MASSTHGSTPEQGTMASTYGSMPEEGSTPKQDVRRSVSSHWQVTREASHEELYGISPKHVENAFIVKVYSLLGCELVLTALVSGIMTLVPSIRIRVVSFVASWPHTYQVLMLVSLIGSLCFLMCVQRKYPMNVCALILFVVVMSTDVGTACCIVYANGAGAMILLSVAITAVIFLALTLYTWVRDVDFSYMGAFLFAALCGLTLLGIANIFLQMKAIHTIYCILGILIFCGYILYDTWQIKTKLGADPDSAIEASIELYLDIVNLFLFILSLLGDR